jgi:hypothetical protein
LAEYFERHDCHKIFGRIVRATRPT